MTLYTRGPVEQRGRLAFGGIPAIAVSCASYGPNIDYRGCASFVAAHLDGLRSLWKAETFVNVNGPSPIPGTVTSIN